MAALLVSCGGDDFLSSQPVTNDAAVSGVTPFIAFVTIHGANLDRAVELRFEIAPAPNASSRPVRATFTRDYLSRHGYVQAPGKDITVPLFGLYAGSRNSVEVGILFADGSVKYLPVSVTTNPYVDANGVYDHVTAVQPRVATASLGFDYLYIRNNLGAPVILDTDGQVRWTGTGVTSSSTALFVDNGFVVGSSVAPTINRLELDGTVTQAGTAPSDVIDFHHDIERGKTGLFANVNVVDGGVSYLGSVLDELQSDGTQVGQWNMSQIIANFMTANGDDPTPFVRPSADWFHMNSAIYDSRDDSVVVSSRENFVIKVDYATKGIRWILGDPTKYWHTFASLRGKALTLQGTGLVPIGQHALSFAPDGSLLMFNDGGASFNQPAGAPTGASRPYAAVSDYTIDESTMTATENWHYDHGQTYDSDVCSSAQQQSDGSLLIDYSTTDARTTMHLVGLDASKAVAFDYKLASVPACASGWNAQVIPLHHLFFD